MRRTTILLTLLVAIAVPAAAAADVFPDRIDLPNGFAPEGIATGRATSFYVGSRTGEGIWRGDYRTGSLSPLVEDSGPFTGMKVDRLNQLWVAGAESGTGHVFDAATGAPIATYEFASGATFVNDVVVTHDAAWFTDSFQPVLYRVELNADGTPSDEWRTVDLNGVAFQANTFNVNGIDASADGRTLVLVHSTTGELYRFDTTSETASLIDTGSAGFVNGDGVLLVGSLLYVVQNADQQVSVVRLNSDLSFGTLVDVITPDGVDTPTTAARFGSAIYLVNARFGATPGPSVPYWATRIDR